MHPKISNLFYKILFISLLFSSTPLFACVGYDLEDSRFWLFAPNVSDIRHLLPYAYHPERYYNNARGYNQDTFYYETNIASWKTYLGADVKEADIQKMLYNTSAKAYFAKKYDSNNTFAKVLATKPELRQYFDLAKGYEGIYADIDHWGQNAKQVHIQTNQLIRKCRDFLVNVTDSELKGRAAYLLIKLLRNDERKSEVAPAFEQYFKDNAKKTWYYGSACYFYGEIQRDSVQKATWYAKAWNANAEQKRNIQRFFYHQEKLPFIQNVTDTELRATMYAISGLSYPAPALNFLQNIWKNNPKAPELSMLMAREINKLENWLLTPDLTTPTKYLEDFYKDTVRMAILTTSNNRLEYSYEDTLPSAPLLRKKDIEHLHRCRAFVDEVLKSGKRSDMAFWQLCAAQLAFLDQDFDTATKMAQLAGKQNAIPAQQSVQAQLLVFLAEMGKTKMITPAIADKIPALFDLIKKNKNNIQDVDILQAQLVLLLSNMLIKKGNIAEGCLLLAHTNRIWEVTASGSLAKPYDRLLKIAKPAHFDQALTIIRNPKGNFQKMLVEEGAGRAWFDSNTFNYEIREFEKNPDYTEKWSVDKILECKATYYIRQDKLDSALTTFQSIQPSHFNAAWRTSYRYYLKHNPYTVGIQFPNLPLGDTILKVPFDKISFLKQLIALKQSATKNSGEAKQKDLFLIANAYYNMSFNGRGWWLMNAQNKGSGDMEIFASQTLSSVMPMKHKSNPYMPYSMGGLVLIGILGFGYRKNKGLLVILPILLGSMLYFLACKNENIATNTQNTPARKMGEFEKNYYTSASAKDWYEKAIAAAPKTEIAIASQLMLEHCKIHTQNYQLALEKKYDYWSQETLPVIAPNLTAKEIQISASALSCKAFAKYVGRK